MWCSFRTESFFIGQKQNRKFEAKGRQGETEKKRKPNEENEKQGQRRSTTRQTRIEEEHEDKNAKKEKVDKGVKRTKTRI